MSQTLPVEVVSRSYWAYVASAMAEGLARMLDAGDDPAVVPRRVYSDAQEFFRLALEAAGDAVPQNPSVSIANYMIAVNTVRDRREDASCDRLEIKRTLSTYTTLLAHLERGEAIPADSRDVAGSLLQFFTRLQREAEAESYDQIVRFDSPTQHFLGV